MTLWGWDASDYDWPRGPMDYAAAYRDGIRVATFKATEGTSIRHSHYGEALSRARAAGIPYLGAYAVVRTPGNGGAGPVSAQCDHLLTYATSATPWWPEHPGWFWQVDLEKWQYDNVAPGYGAQMADILTQRTGRPAVLYAPKWAYGNTIPQGAPLWQSDYGSNPAAHYLQVYPGDSSARWAPYSGRTPLVLQFGSRCTIGSQPVCDANAIRDVAAWERLFGGSDMALSTEKVTTFALDDDLIAHPEPNADGSTTMVAGDVLGLADAAAWKAARYGKQIVEKLDALTATVGGLGDVKGSLIAAFSDPAVVEVLRTATTTDAVKTALAEVIGSVKLSVS